MKSELPLTPGAVIRRPFGSTGLFHYGVASNNSDEETKEQMVFQYGGPQDDDLLQDGGFWAKFGDKYFSSDSDVSMSDRVEMTRLSTFADGAEVEVVAHAPNPIEAMRRANSMLGEARYNPLRRNCEHFANYVAFGNWKSSQSRTIGAAAISGVGGLLSVVLAALIYRRK